MNKNILSGILFFLISFTANAQWEFQYFVFRAGINHNIFSKQPDSIPEMYMKTPDGEMHLKAMPFFLDYTPGFHTGLYFHIDFDNDKGGLVIGGEYNLNGISAKYETANEKYWLIQRNYNHSFGLPVMLKFGKEIFNEQNYFFVGAQYNFNISLINVEKTNWVNQNHFAKAEQGSTRKNNMHLFFGYNYMVFNFEVDYYPQNFLNPDYSVKIISDGKSEIVYPYKNQPSKLLFFKTSINVPLSPWTTKKSYKLHKFLRKFR